MLSSFGKVSAMEMDPTARKISLQKTDGLYDIRLGACPSGIPFVNVRFDLICLIDVLEHIEEDVETLVAVKSLLSERGRILITVPANRWLWSSHDDFLYHKRRYSVSELRKKAAESGLSINKLSYYNTFMFPLEAIVRLKDKILAKSSASGTKIPSSIINKSLMKIFSAERYLIRLFDLPFGVSLFCVLYVSMRKSNVLQRSLMKKAARFFMTGLLIDLS